MSLNRELEWLLCRIQEFRYLNPSKEVARATLSALGRTVTVRHGRLSILLEALLALLPRWARTRIMAQVMGGYDQAPNLMLTYRYFEASVKSETH